MSNIKKTTPPFQKKSRGYNIDPRTRQLHSDPANRRFNDQSDPDELPDRAAQQPLVPD
jgi:hypothetical protein